MKKLFILLFLACSHLLFAQQKPQPPIPIEVMFGNNRANFQLTINKQIAGRWWYGNITTATADYQNRRSETELVMVNSLIYRFQNNLGASAGLQYHFLKGFVPNIALHASYANPTWLLVLTPYLNLMPDCNSETVGIVEFKPQLCQNLRLYTRAMGLYNHNITQNYHDRSFYYFRLGLSINRFTFGAAANLDYYGPKRICKENFGGFCKIDL